MTGFLIALLSGALMSVQGVFNTQVTKTTGMWVSNGWVQFSAFLLCAVAWLIAGRDSVGALWKVEPRYVLLGGVDRCRDHMDCDQEYGVAGTGESSTSDRDIAVDRSICDRTSRVVWSRQRTAGNTQNYWYVHCPDWCCNFSMEIVQLIH